MGQAICTGPARATPLHLESSAIPSGCPKEWQLNGSAPRVGGIGHALKRMCSLYWSGMLHAVHILVIDDWANLRQILSRLGQLFRRTGFQSSA